MNIGSLIPPVNTLTPKELKRREIAVAGTEVSKDAPHKPVEQKSDKRKGKDRRQRQVKPLVDMRSGRDRRKGEGKLSINITV